MNKILLESKPREIIGKKIRALRREGILPGVVYGHKRKPQPIQVSYKDFKKVYKEASGSSIVTLQIGKKEESVLIHEVDVDPVTEEYRHADFYKINLKEKITTEVPLLFKGTAKAVKDLEGTLVKNFAEVEIECYPTEIPKEIEVDISVLSSFEDVIKMSELDTPKGVKILDDESEVIATVTPPRSEEELEALEEEVVEDVEAVEGVKKEDEDVDGDEDEEGEKKDEKKEEKEGDSTDEGAPKEESKESDEAPKKEK